MFACLELLKVSESVARRTGDLSAQVGRRVVCVAPCRLSKPVQAKSARLVPKDCPSVKRGKKLFWRLGDNLRKSGGLCFFLWHLGLDRISYGRHASCVQVLGSRVGRPRYLSASDRCICESRLLDGRAIFGRKSGAALCVLRRVDVVRLLASKAIWHI